MLYSLLQYAVLLQMFSWCWLDVSSVINNRYYNCMASPLSQTSLCVACGFQNVSHERWGWTQYMSSLRDKLTSTETFSGQIQHTRRCCLGLRSRCVCVLLMGVSLRRWVQRWRTDVCGVVWWQHTVISDLTDHTIQEWADTVRRCQANATNRLIEGVVLYVCVFVCLLLSFWDTGKLFLLSLNFKFRKYMLYL